MTGLVGLVPIRPRAALDQPILGRLIRWLNLMSKVRVDLLRFSKQVRNVLFRHFDQTRHLSQLFGKLACKLSLLFISPSLFKLVHLSAKRGRSFFQILGKPMQMAGELTQLFWVDNGLVHEKFLIRGALISGTTNGVGDQEIPFP